MKKLLLGISILALTSVVALAGPIEDRQALMKAIGKTVGGLAPIAKGEARFDAAAVAAGLAALNEHAMKLDIAALFPVGSETGGDTTASPKIWEDTAGFTAAADKLKADVAAAVATPAADLPAFQAQFGAIGKDCGACHGAYRVKKG